MKYFVHVFVVSRLLARSSLHCCEKWRRRSRRFRKILDHSGVVGNEPIGSLAYLGLARSHSLSNDTTKAKTTYQDFLAMRKNADPEIPILKQAKAEYAKLQ